MASPSETKALLTAAITGNFITLKKLAARLDDGKGIAKTLTRVKDMNDRSVIHFAATEGKIEICKYLVDELKIDVDLKDGKGQTPLAHATFDGHLSTALYFLEKGADPNAKCQMGFTPLHLAAEIGHPQLLHLLLSRGVNVDALSSKGTPLLRAASHGQADAVKILLDHSADPGLFMFHVFTPLLSAIVAKSLSCVELLLEIVTDQASNYKLAGKWIMEESKIYWTPCAAHCVNLMLSDVSDLPLVHDLVEEAKCVTIFIYNHTKVLHLMRNHTDGRDIVRPSVTRFATSFLCLQSIFEQKQKLRNMIASPEWTGSKWANTPTGKDVRRSIKRSTFWNHMHYALKIMAPLVDVVRLVDTEEKPSMGYIYKAMEICKEKVKKNLGEENEEDKEMWKVVEAIIDDRWKAQLNQPLHAAAYYLNPMFYYATPTSPEEMESNGPVKEGLLECITKLTGDLVEEKKIIVQLVAWRTRRGRLGKPNAVACVNDMAPVEWWVTFGSEIPELQRFAKRVLGLTTSASPCERNWSTFSNAGADPDASSCGVTPLSVAVSEGEKNMITRLLDAGADPNLTNGYGLIPMEIAALEANHEFVQILFPLTSPIPSFPDWSFEGILRHVHSEEALEQRKLKTKELFLESKSKGQKAFQQKDYDAAIFHYSQASECAPCDATVLSNRSLCWTRKQEGEMALSDAQACIGLRPDWPKGYYREGAAWNVLKKFDRAADAFFEGLKLDSKNEELLKAFKEAAEARMKSAK